MTGQQDFQAALAKLQTTVTALPGAVQALIAAHNNDDDAAFEAAATQLTSMTDAIANATGSTGATGA